jgi:Tol biopolymer transport system component
VTALKTHTALLAMGLAALTLGGGPMANGQGAPVVSRGDAPSGSADAAAVLAEELHGKGWLVCSAQTHHGDWDLVLLRPDGSARRPLTNTPEFNEAGARFSPDGNRLLYYRLPKGEPADNNTYGTFELVLANSNGTEPVVFGPGFSWASWGPDGRRIACLNSKSIQIVEIATRQVVRQHPRHGLVEQLVWSPDGKWFVGTANGLGPFWNIGVLNPITAEILAVSETDRYNCTPDWTPDAGGVVYARGIVPERGGQAELWWARRDGGARRRLYTEAGRHIYGACASPDGRFLLFTRSVEDLGKVMGTTLSIIRWPDSAAASNTHQSPVPRLDLGPGWEPHWTAHEVAAN